MTPKYLEKRKFQNDHLCDIKWEQLKTEQQVFLDWIMDKYGISRKTF